MTKANKEEIERLQKIIRDQAFVVSAQDKRLEDLWAISVRVKRGEIERLKERIERLKIHLENIKTVLKIYSEEQSQ